MVTLEQRPSTHSCRREKKEKEEAKKKQDSIGNMPHQAGKVTCSELEALLSGQLETLPMLFFETMCGQ